MKRYMCEVCSTKFDSYPDASNCLKTHKVVEDTETPDPTVNSEAGRRPNRSADRY